MTPELSRPLVVLDLETTGTNTRIDRIIELSAIKLNPDGTEESRTWLLNPGVPIPPETTAIHGYDDAMVKDCPQFAQKAEEIKAFIGDADLGGFNSDRFDVPCLVEEFARAGVLFNIRKRRLVDVMKIFHRFEPRDLSAASRFYLGREIDGAHHAAADVRATVDVLKAQLDRYAELPRTPEGIENFLSPQDPMNLDRAGTFRWKNGELTVNFGRRKGEKVMDLLKNERKFIKWIADGDFPPEVRKVCMDLLEGRPPPAPPQA